MGKKNSMSTLGIALGGGGTRGFAHLGVLKALEERGIVPDAYAGTSAGAIVASLLATKKKPDEIMEIMKEMQISDAAKIRLSADGFASLDNLKKQLDEILEEQNFEDLDYPLYIAVSNLLTGRVEYISEGNIAKAVQASSSIPILFAPVEINGQLYVDGGLLDNVPVKPLVGKCEMIIAIDISPIESVEKVEGLSEIMARVFQMSVSMQEDVIEHCDLLIRLGELAKYSILDTSNNEETFEIGYQHGKTLDIPNIKKLMKY